MVLMCHSYPKKRKAPNCQQLRDLKRPPMGAGKCQRSSHRQYICEVRVGCISGGGSHLTRKVGRCHTETTSLF